MPLAESIASALAVELGKKAYRRLTSRTPVSLAIQTASVRLAKEGLEIEGHLKSWIISKEFQSICKDVVSTKISATDESVLMSFIESVDLYLGEEATDERNLEVAERVVTVFLEEMENHLLNSEQGLTTLSSQVKEGNEASKRREQEQTSLLKQIVAQTSNLPFGEFLESTEGKLKDLLEVTSDKLKDRKYKDARNTLNIVLETVPVESLGRSLISRIENQLGVCELMVGERGAARSHFNRSLELEPDNPNTLGNLAMLTFMDGNLKDAVSVARQAVKVDARHSQSTSILIRALQKTSGIEAVSSLIKEKPWVRDDANCLLGLGIAYYEEERFDEATECLEKAIAIEGFDKSCYLILGASHISPVLKSLQVDPPLAWKLPDTTYSRLEKALKYSDLAVKSFGQSEARTDRIESYRLRASVNSLLGNYSDAIEDCNTIIDIDPDNDAAKDILAQSLFEDGKYREAEKVYRAIEDQEVLDRTVYQRAFCLAKLERFQEASTVLSENWDPTEFSSRMVLIADMFLNVHILSTAEPHAVAKEEIEKYVSDPELDENFHARIIRSKLLMGSGEFERARVELESFLTIASANQAIQLKLELGTQLAFQGIWTDAAVYLDEVVSPGVPTETAFVYVETLINSGRDKDALAFLTRVREEIEFELRLVEIEVGLMETLGFISKAYELLGELCEVESNPIYLLEAARLSIRLGESEQATKLVSQIDRSAIASDSRALAKLSRLTYVLGLPDARDLAYRALLTDYGNPQMHINYLGICVHSENENEQVELDVVDVETAVTLKYDNGNEQVFVLSDSDPSNHLGLTLRQTDSLSGKLLGKRVGDAVALKESEFGDLNAKVISVTSKYTFAVRRLLADFERLFGADNRLLSLDVGEDDFSLFFRQLDRRFAHVSHVLELYKQHQLPVSLVSKLVGRSRLDSWLALTAKEEGQLFFRGGERELLAIDSDCKDVVIDLIALLTGESLNLLQLLEKKFGTIYYSQELFEELNQCIGESQNTKKSSETVYRTSEGNYNFVSNSGLQEARLDRLTRIKEFLTNSATRIEGATSEIGDRAKVDEIAKVLGRTALSAIAIAKTKGIPLLVDDLGISTIAGKEFDLPSYSFQTVLLSALESGDLQEEEYHESIMKLVLSNYRSPVLTVKDFLWVCQRFSWRLEPEVKYFLRELEDAQTSALFVANVTSELVKNACLNLSQDVSRDLFIDFLLTSLGKRSDVTEVVSRLKMLLVERMRLLPVYLPKVLATIRIWEQVKGY